MDERLIDLPISVVFWKLVFSETAILDDVEKIDKHFYKGLKLVEEFIDKREKLKLTPSTPSYAKESYKKGCEDSQYLSKKSGVIDTSWNCEPEQEEPELTIEDLCLNFTLPGDEGIELVENGAEKNVTSKNMKEYVRASLN